MRTGHCRCQTTRPRLTLMNVSVQNLRPLTLSCQSRYIVDCHVCIGDQYWTQMLQFNRTLQQTNCITRKPCCRRETAQCRCNFPMRRVTVHRHRNRDVHSVVQQLTQASRRSRKPTIANGSRVLVQSVFWVKQMQRASFYVVDDAIWQSSN